MKKQSNKLKIKPLSFWGERRGTTAIEFAIVVPVFLGLMFSVFEVGWFYFVNSTVSAATTQSSRIIRTGQAQLGGWEEDEFFATVCDVVDAFGDCDDTLTVDVATFMSFQELAEDTSDATCADAPPEEINEIPYEPGAENAIVRVRICLIYNTFNPAIGVNLADEGSTQRHITSVLIFRNEPYERNET